MEILIPGLLLVALMVYASTRIKKSAAKAYEAESIETGEFVVQKPAGFLHVVDGDPHYVFESYSKDYGTNGAEEFRQATATLTVRKGLSLADAASGALRSGGRTVSDSSEVVDGLRYRNIEMKLNKKGIDFRVIYKLAERDGKVYEFEANAIAETTADIARNIEAMVNSFALK